MKKPVLIAAVTALLAVILVLANQWRGRFDLAPVELDVATPRGVEDARTSARVADSTVPAEPSTATLVTDDAPVVPREPVAPERDFAALLGGIDPSLRGQNLIVRAQSSESAGPGFEDVVSRFSAEGTDPNWSDGMEARILDQVSQLSGLKLVSIDAECRETICRVKLFYPPSTNAFSSLDQLRPIANQIGFDHVVEAATVGDDGVPISLLYFQRNDA